jgi:hypothetical protein
MRKKNLLLRYFGFVLLMVGFALNIKMYVNEEWPTYLFLIVCFIGIIQIVLSYTLMAMNSGWQAFWALLPFGIVLIYLI